MRSDFQYVLDVARDEGPALASTPLDPDWEPAVEAARLAGLRAHGAGAAAAGPDATVEPVWHPEHGEPRIAGVRVTLAPPGLPAWHEDVPLGYFGEAGRALASRLVQEGVLAAGDRVWYRVTAYPRDAARAAPAALRFDVRDAPPPLVLADAPLDARRAASVECGDRTPGDLEAFLPTSALDEALALAAGAGARETGGVLIGHLHRDAATGELFVEVTSQVPARHTVGDSVTLTFTSETWTDVRAAVALRRKGEVMLGWWHSHPAREWCKACPEERQRACRFATGFLSADDRALHRAIFPQAWTLALVITDALGGTDVSLFGWRRGVLDRRGFRWLGGAARARRDRPAPVEAASPCPARADTPDEGDAAPAAVAATLA